MPRPNLKQVPTYFHGYINQVKGNDVVEEMKNQTPEMIRFFKKIPAAKWDYRYAKGKWSLKELLLHMIDAERVFGYRALCFARKDKTPLPSFDENIYSKNSKASKRDWTDMLAELKSLRQSNEIMFGSFDNDQLRSIGVANNNSMSVNAIGYVIVGHVIHHMKIIRERYL